MEASLVFEQTRGEQDVEHPKVSFTVSIIFRKSLIHFKSFLACSHHEIDFTKSWSQNRPYFLSKQAEEDAKWEWESIAFLAKRPLPTHQLFQEHLRSCCQYSKI